MSTYFPPLQKVDELKRPAEIGQMYLVPSVKSWQALRVPVLTPSHDDESLVGIAGNHYHYDTRFLPVNLMDRIFGKQYNLRELAQFTPDQKASLISVYVVGSNEQTNYHPFICLRDFPEYPDASFTHKLQRQLQGERLGADKICRHQGMDLSGVRVKKGCITCPMHGAEYDSTTGLARPCLMGKLK